MTIDFPTDRPIDLPEHGSWPASKHRFDASSVWAIKAALAARRPLLVRGNPGTGKSQLARAAAQQLGRCFVAEVVHSGTESQDLQCHFDAVGRLGEAQALAAACHIGIGKDEAQDRLDPQRYLAPGPLWWVFDWKGAKEQAGMARCNHRMPAAPAGWTPDKGCVLLIDEIDKANADLPNGLLETLGNGGFSVPHLKEPLCVGSRSRGVPPLVVVTTNEERELPDAFVRRCLVLHLFLPDEVRDRKEEDKKKALVEHLTVRGRDHFPFLEESVLEEAAAQLWTDRETARSLGVSPPGMAEYLDLLRAVQELGKDCKERLGLLETIGKFVLQKHPEML